MIKFRLTREEAERAQWQGKTADQTRNELFTKALQELNLLIEDERKEFPALSLDKWIFPHWLLYSYVNARNVSLLKQVNILLPCGVGYMIDYECVAL